MRKAIISSGRVLGALVLCVGLIMTGCVKNNDALEEHGNRLENLEDVQIKAIQEQIGAIKTSVTTLENVDANLQKLIDDLEAEATDLQTQLDANSAADAATKKALEDEIANIKTLIEALQAKDTELDQKIADLKTYVDSELKSTEDWANATFATLSQYSAVQTEIATIKALIEQYKTDITSAYTKAIEDAIVVSETSMKTWVNELLAKDYYDIAEINAKLEALENELLASDNILAEQIIAQQTALDQAKSELTEAYNTAIEEAININNGVIRGEIANSIAAAKEELEAKISTIEARLTDIESRLSGVEQNIAEILSMIQSVAYMPEYSDGVTYVDATEKTAEMSFKISPSSAVTALEDVWSQALSVKYITTAITKAAPVMKDLLVTSAEFDETLGTISLIVNCENLDATFFEGSTTASAALFISDGTSSVSSEFISLQLPANQEGGEGDVEQVGPVAMELSEITASTVTFTGTVTDVDAIPYIEKITVYYKEASETFSIISAMSASTTEINSDNTVSISLRLSYNTSYSYCLFVESRGVKTYSDVKQFTTENITGTDLTKNSPANCYIVSEAGTYIFKTIKGNSFTSVGTVVKAEVLWESFGTSTTPSVGDLVKNVTYKGGYIAFEATDKKGNAVIAAKDASGKILWSWHIWLTDQPQAQVYNNNAGTMMDRNLGATSATPGDVGALGLLYQWGRKDPFLGSSSIDDEVYAKSTLTWPSAVESTSSTGTIDYVTANPTTFVTRNSNNYDWYYSDVEFKTDNTRWQSEKTIYDPCPPGWRVPDGGDDGVWSTAVGSRHAFDYTYDSTNKGINLSGKFGSASTIWYPSLGRRDSSDGRLDAVGSYGYYFSVTPNSYSACNLSFNLIGNVSPSNSLSRANGCAVRCLQE